MVKSNFKINIMKKVITIMCLAAAPILFAQEKQSQAKQIKNEKVSVEQEKAQKIENHKKVQAEKANKKTEVRATGPKSNVTKKAVSVEGKKK